jgi:pilus assembly protein CpaF
VREILGVTGRTEGDNIETSELFGSRDGSLQRAGGYPPHAQRYQAAGYELAELLQGQTRFTPGSGS